LLGIGSIELFCFFLGNGCSAWASIQCGCETLKGNARMAEEKLLI